MKAFYTISLLLFFSVGFAQKNKLEGIWVEYKREVVCDTSLSNFTFNNRQFHPTVLLTIRENECFFTIDKKTELLSYYVAGDTLTLTGFEKTIFTRSYIYSVQSKEELILLEIDCENSQTSFHRKLHFKKSNQYPEKRNNIYIVDKKKNTFPTFPGGTDSLKRFLNTKLDLQNEFNSVKLNETVTIMLVFDQNGKILSTEIIGDAWPELAKESIRLIKLMPNWKMKSDIKKIIYDGTPKFINPYFTFYTIEIQYLNQHNSLKIK